MGQAGILSSTSVSTSSSFMVVNGWLLWLSVTVAWRGGLLEVGGNGGWFCGREGPILGAGLAEVRLHGSTKL